MADARGAVPVVSKALEAALVVLYIGLVTAALYGGVVPEYRAAAGGEVAERTVAGAAADVESAVPPGAVAADVRAEVELPATIAGAAYRVRADGDRLVLEHPDPAVGASAPLVLPDRVASVEGTWESGGTAHVRVRTTAEGLEVRLE